MATVPTKLLHLATDFVALTGHGTVVAVSHIGLADAATGGTFYAIQPIGGASPYVINVADGGNLVIPVDGFQIVRTGVTGAVWPNAAALASLDLNFGAGTPASFYVRLFSTPPAGDGSGGTEFPATGNYVTRVTSTVFTNNTTNFPNATLI